MEKIFVPRVISVLLIYIMLLGLFVFVGSNIINPLISQSVKLGENLPQYINSAFPFFAFDAQTISQNISPISQNILKVSVGLFGNIVAIFTVFVISFYLILERKYLELNLSRFMGRQGALQLVGIIGKVEQRLGAWVRGQVTLGLIIGLGTYIGLALLEIPYSMPLAIIAGILEIIPNIGPIISAIPAILVAATISPVYIIAVILLYFVVQQLENHLVVPIVMRSMVGLPPLVTIIAVMIGAKLGGIGGALLSVPIVVTVETIVSSYLKLKEPAEDSAGKENLVNVN